MTKHAEQRIAERFPGVDPWGTLQMVQHAVAMGAVRAEAESVSGETIYRFPLADGREMFPVVTKDGAVKTVLSHGMEITTPTGRTTLGKRLLGPGVHFIDSEAYFADPSEVPSLNSTTAKLLLMRSPAHAWHAHPRLNPAWEPEIKTTFDIGTAAHRAILGKGASYHTYPEHMLASNGAASTAAAKEWAEDIRAAGGVPLKADQVDAIGLMQAKAADHLGEVGIMLDPARAEVVVIGEIEGVLCRSMIDNAPTDPAEPLYDFKTTTDANPEACVRAVMNYGYDIQARFYIEAWKAATGEDRRFRFIFQEKEAPFEVCVVELCGDDLDMAAKKTRRAREIWRNCLSSNHWPGYPAGVHRLELPGWFTERWLERESVEGEYRRRHGHDILDQARRWQSPHAAE